METADRAVDMGHGHMPWPSRRRNKVSAHVAEAHMGRPMEDDGYIAFRARAFGHEVGASEGHDAAPSE